MVETVSTELQTTMTQIDWTVKRRKVYTIRVAFNDITINAKLNQCHLLRFVEQEILSTKYYVVDLNEGRQISIAEGKLDLANVIVNSHLSQVQINPFSTFSDCISYINFMYSPINY